MRQRIPSPSLVRGAASLAVAILAAMPGAARAQTAGVVVRRDTTIILRGAAAGGRLPLDSIKEMMRRLDQEDFGSPAWVTLSLRLDSLVNLALPRAAASLHAQRARMPVVRGWVGFDAQGPATKLATENALRVTYLAYPSIISVEPESPAARAGIVPGDVLVAYNGIDVVGHEFNITDLLTPDRKLDVRVRRDGEPHDYTLTVARPPQRITLRALALPSKTRVDGDGFNDVLVVPPAMRMIRPPMLPGNVFIISHDGVLGASMSTVSPELAQALKLGGTGVLVTQVVESSPAAVAGVHAGDLVVSVDAKPVSSLEELRAIVQANMGRHEIPLRVVRDRKTRDITLKW